ncbi:hypothetical protein D3C75_1266430 [compost metagenome]
MSDIVHEPGFYVSRCEQRIAFLKYTLGLHLTTWAGVMPQGQAPATNMLDHPLPPAMRRNEA